MNFALLTALGLSALPVESGRLTLVVCAPGAPGSTVEAQPTLDRLVSALASKAGMPGASLGAIYENTLEACMARLASKDAALTLMSLPVYLEKERELGLRARLQPVSQGRPALERWALVAKKGRVSNAAALRGLTLYSTAGFAPGFVRGPAMGSWGPLSRDVKVAQSTAILSSLRRAAAGEPIAVLLDGEQEAALASLPFASALEVVNRSAPLPSGVLAVVGTRSPMRAQRALETAFQALSSDAAGAVALEGIRTTRFEAVDERALGAGRKAYAEAHR